MGNTAPIAVTMGEPSGIGGEITLKAWRDNSTCLPDFFLIDDPIRLGALCDSLEWDIPIREISGPEQVFEIFKDALPVLPIRLKFTPIPGHPLVGNGESVLNSIKIAVELAKAGDIDAVVTNPIQKKALYDDGFPFPGHTEFLAHLAQIETLPAMMLACEGLRVVPVTVHKSLHSAINSLTQEAIVTTAKETVRSLINDFGIKCPHIMVSALNPHAGEEGSLGSEEIEIIHPAVKELKKEGFSVTGPAPADTLFHNRARAAYDAVICMYHDQALIPIKTIDFRSGVNITLGLPFIRTSPDHGTALEIAGTGVADEASLIAALRVAASIAQNRRRSKAVAGV